MSRFSDQAILDIIRGGREFHCVSSDGQALSPPSCLLPGSFNPIHRAHRAMALYAAEYHGHRVDFEMSVSNVDKPPLAFDEIARRLDSFQTENVWLTSAPTFVQKATLFPNCLFIVGADTAVRLFDPKYYASESGVAKAIHHFLAKGTRFLAFGRMLGGEHFVDAGSLEIPDQARQLFDFVPEFEFRMDVSSTELRRKRNSE